MMKLPKSAPAKRGPKLAKFENQQPALHSQLSFLSVIIGVICGEIGFAVACCLLPFACRGPGLPLPKC